MAHKVKFTEVGHLYFPFSFTWVQDAVPFKNGERGIMDAEHWKYWDENKKPLLRRLVDITDDEKKELFKLIFNREFPSHGMITWYPDTTVEHAPRWVLHNTGVERLCIQINGYVWADSDLLHYKFNQHLVTKFFLDKKFDLFEQIPDGEAIDNNK